MYATLERNPHEIHTEEKTNSPIGHKMGSVKGATMGSTLGAVKNAVKSAAITTSKPSQSSIRYIPIHLHKAIRTIRIKPEGQEAD